MIRQNTVGIKL